MRAAYHGGRCVTEECATSRNEARRGLRAGLHYSQGHGRVDAEWWPPPLHFPAVPGANPAALPHAGGKVARNYQGGSGSCRKTAHLGRGMAKGVGEGPGMTARGGHPASARPPGRTPDCDGASCLSARPRCMDAMGGYTSSKILSSASLSPRVAWKRSRRSATVMPDRSGPPTSSTISPSCIMTVLLPKASA